MTDEHEAVEDSLSYKLTDEQREQLEKAMNPTIYQALTRLDDETPVFHYGREPEQKG